MNNNIAGILLFLFALSCISFGGLVFTAVTTKDCDRDQYFTFFGDVYTCKKVGEKSVLIGEGINNLLKNNED